MRTLGRVIIADRAISLFIRELQSCKPGPRDVIALVYMSSFINRDGTPVDGFAPGYMVGPLGAKYLSDRWILARQDGLREFYVDPRGEWGDADAMSIDLAATKYAMFSIVPS